jgi:GntR family uxuAB operon transcriptional repressor
VEKAIIPPEKKPYQEIGDDLRAQIAQGRYPIGSRLPPERNIAETYGVSRTIVREALLMLELQGTVDIRQGSGVYVMRIPHEDDSEEEQMLSSDVGPFEILQARQLLESNIAAFAAKMATRADIDNLKRIIEQEQRAIAANDTSQDNARCFTWCWPGRRKIRCCWRRSSASGCRWTAARCGSSSTCISPAGRTG